MKKNIAIISKQEDKRLIYGVVYEPNVVDSQDEFAEASEIEKAAHAFLKDYAIVKVMHQDDAPDTDIVESYIAPANLTLEDGQPITKGTWVIAIKVNNDAIWKRVKSGELGGLSMGGSGEREAV